jgi:hypothetical protein
MKLLRQSTLTRTSLLPDREEQCEGSDFLSSSSPKPILVGGAILFMAEWKAGRQLCRATHTPAWLYGYYDLLAAVRR